MPENIENILNYKLWLNTVEDILISLWIFLILFFIVKFLLKRLDKIKENKSDKKWLNYISSVFYKIPKWLFIAIEIYIAISFLKFSEPVQLVLKSIFLFIITIFLIKLVIKCINISLDKVLSKDKTAKNTLETIVKVIVRCFWIFILLVNLWIDLTPLLAWFWVAWIAVAFALQNILSDLFSSFSIILSKPFIVGDYIKIWEWSSEKIWTVKKITLKSTTLQTVQWQEVIIPNSNVLATEVINYRTMKNRRQRINIWVTYDTWLKKLKLIPEIIKEVVSKQQEVEYEWCYLEKMWEFSINFLMSYNILDPDLQKSLEINEKIYLWIIEKFQKEWIEFAFPSQTIYVKE
jgi:small-conductance mechanosensitive channel